ncbi:site-2 protease family protein [Candidatus Micrarchaeota archaeon]|nr:site-2 protease family protein [Candidatus Micrarchaeota archaeon]MBU1682141.1 site-2 protease family protein [Candidatus Micrarchaeota archaeon]
MYRLYLEKDEIIQIAISVVAISVALGIVFARPEGILDSPTEFLVFLAPLFVTVGSGFILHEMAHKLVAIYYGAHARFKMWTQGLIFMLATSMLGVLFAAPGAVYIEARHITRKENGIIFLAGPALNIILVAFFVALNSIAPIEQYYSFLAKFQGGFAGFGIAYGILNVWQFGAAMNLILALFNMIPAFPLDGSKVYAWKRMIWLLSVGFLLFVGGIIIGPAIMINFVIMFVIIIVFSKLLFG